MTNTTNETKMKPKSKTCSWTYVGSHESRFTFYNEYKTTCKSTESDSEAKFCPNCGKKVKLGTKEKHITLSVDRD